MIETEGDVANMSLLDDWTDGSKYTHLYTKEGNSSNNNPLNDPSEHNENTLKSLY